jgi:single-stranded DNA-specific DHH superfamily exonuclease
MGRGASEQLEEASSRRGNGSRSNVHRLGGKMVIELHTESQLEKARSLSKGMQEIADERGLGVLVDPVAVARIPEDDPERALAWYLGSRELIPDPEEVVPGMGGAARMLSEAIDRGEKIALFADYDVDGVTAGEIMRNTLSSYGEDPLMGYADMRDGFGLTKEFVEQAYAEGCSTLVTVDVGTAAEEAVMLAKALGMNVIVTDHHNARGHDDNEADFHLNPDLFDPPTSSATGAQLSWYLAAALQEERDGTIREDHYGENLYLAGLGCNADFGDLNDSSNRPFLLAKEVPGNIQRLADEKRESSEIGRMITTQALLNLAKRTDSVSGADVARLLRAKTEEEWQEAYEYLTESKKAQDEVRKEMQAEITRQAVSSSGDRVVHHVFSDPRTAGSAGTVAASLGKASAKPAFIFCKLKDENGEEIYKFSGRGSGRREKIGKLKEYAPLIEVVGENNVGGHPEVFSGTCRAEDIPRIVELIEEWAKGESSMDRKNSSGPRIYVDERNISPERFRSVEEAKDRLAPYNGMAGVYAPNTSVKGTISEITRKGASHTATITLENGDKHRVSISRHPKKELGDDGKITHADVHQGETVEIFLEHRVGTHPIVRHTAPLSQG